jgi:hypothetical protein
MCTACTQVPDSDAAYDLGPFWYEGRTPDGVTFWFRKRNPNQLSEFEVSWNHPEAGNATGSGTVGGARVIGIGELERCTDIAGRSKVSAARLHYYSHTYLSFSIQVCCVKSRYTDPKGAT